MSKFFSKTMFIITVGIFFAALPLFGSAGSDSVIRWEQVPLSTGYIVEIRDERRRVIVRTTTRNNFYNVSLPEGKYEFRLSVINRLGETEVSSPWSPFAVLMPEPEPEVELPEETVDPETVAQAEEIPETVEEVDDESTTPFWDKLLYDVALMPLFSYPTGVIGELFGVGFGVRGRAGVRHLAYENVDLGLDFSYIHFTGEEAHGTKGMNHFSYLLYGGYYYEFMESYFVQPQAAFGFTSSSITPLEGYSYDVDKIVNLAINFNFTVAKKIDFYYIPVSVGVTFLSDAAGMIPFYSLHAGIGTTFDSSFIDFLK